MVEVGMSTAAPNGHGGPCAIDRHPQGVPLLYRDAALWAVEGDEWLSADLTEDTKRNPPGRSVRALDSPHAGDLEDAASHGSFPLVLTE